jgi:class 3 adenylate cyclase
MAAGGDRGARRVLRSADVASAVQAGGGHVLKFIGDGVLCVFETNHWRDGDAARAALAVGRTILAPLAERNKEPALGAGSGLHIGTVMYGNGESQRQRQRSQRLSSTTRHRRHRSRGLSIQT